MIYIGIDPGTHTGIAAWDDQQRKLIELETLMIHQAMSFVLRHSSEDVFVVFEDARQRKWYGNDWSKTQKKIKGAGSIERDCSIWEDFLSDHKIPFRAVPPQKGMTKADDVFFKAMTGWKGRTSNHARDAAMLVFGK